MLRKFIAVSLIALIILLGCTSASFGQPIKITEQPSISASSAILVDAKTGQILFEKNARERRSIASTTKMMTAIITIERAKLDEQVNISKLATQVGESQLQLQPGEKMSVKSLLYGLLLRSGNDTAVALAEYVGKSIAGFADLMNRKASSIGANDTHFANPHGLYDQNHYSTAYDLSLIARYCLKDVVFSKIVATKEYTIPRSSFVAETKIKNHNKLLWQYPFATGIKTGYIHQAGFCLVSSANKNGIELVCIVLNSPTSNNCFQDSKNLLEYGFNQFSLRRVVKKNGVYGKVKLPEIMDEKLDVVAAVDLRVLVSNAPNSLKEVVVVKDKVGVPIRKGQKLGEIEVTQFGRSLGKVDLLARRTIAKPGPIVSFFLWLKYMFNKISGDRLSYGLRDGLLVNV